MQPVECKAGSYSTEGQSSCVACSDGFYNILNGSSACLKCPAGKSCEVSYWIIIKVYVKMSSWIL